MNNEIYDDHLVATIVSQCLIYMREYPTQTKMTACFNLTERILRLFTIQGSKEDVTDLINEFSEGLKDSIKDME